MTPFFCFQLLSSPTFRAILCRIFSLVMDRSTLAFGFGLYTSVLGSRLKTKTALWDPGLAVYFSVSNQLRLRREG